MADGAGKLHRVYLSSCEGLGKLHSEMREALSSDDGLLPSQRWEPRRRAACVFCARLHWSEDLRQEYLAGDYCFMKNPAKVAELLSLERYQRRWPLIPYAELKASCVRLEVEGKKGTETKMVLLHKRRVSVEQAQGLAPIHCCDDCYEAFSPNAPWLCKFSLANDLWLEY